MPSVTALIEYSSSSAGAFTISSMARNTACTGPGADRGVRAELAVRAAQPHGGGRHAVRAARHLHRVELEVFAAAPDLARGERLEVGVGDALLLVGQHLEARERGVERLALERVAELAQAHGEGVAARVLAEHEQRLARRRPSPAA